MPPDVRTLSPNGVHACPVCFARWDHSRCDGRGDPGAYTSIQCCGPKCVDQFKVLRVLAGEVPKAKLGECREGGELPPW